MLAIALHMARTAASYSSDLPFALVLATAGATIYAILDGSDARNVPAESAYDLFVVALLLAAAVTIKLPSGVFAATALPIALIGWWQRDRQSRASRTRTLTWVAGGLVLLGTACIARGVITSGYPFFPISVAGFPVDWAVPVEHANAEAAWTAYTERESKWGGVGWAWVRLMFRRDIYAALVPSCLAAVALWVTWRYGRPAPAPTGSARWTGWLFAPAVIAIGAWLATAPSHHTSRRFSGYQPPPACVRPNACCGRA